MYGKNNMFDIWIFLDRGYVKTASLKRPDSGEILPAMFENFNFGTPPDIFSKPSKICLNMSPDHSQTLPKTFQKSRKSDPDPTKKGLQSVTQHAKICVKIQGSKGHPTCRGLKYLEILWWDFLRFVWLGECSI